MQISFMIKMYFTGFFSLVKKYVSKNQLKEIKTEYFRILKDAGDIGKKNNLLSSYCLCALFISLVRKTDKTPDQWIKIMEDEIRTSSMIKAFMGNADGYFSEKRMDFRRKWSKETHERKYEDDWVVDIIEGNGDFVMGYDYTECGVCKLCKKENCFSLASYLCKLDFLLVEVMGITLKRTTTLADGGDKCDFRFYRK